MFIKAHFEFLPETISKLEAKGLALTKSMELIQDGMQKINKILGKFWEKIQLKLRKVFDRNPGYEILSKINQVLLGVAIDNSIQIANSDGSIQIKEALISKYKFAAFESTDVERSFSAYKLVLSDKRHNLTMSSLEHIMVVYCKKNYVL